MLSPTAEGVNFFLQPGGERPRPARRPDLTDLLKTLASETGEVGEEDEQKINFAGVGGPTSQLDGCWVLSDIKWP